jgi:hypothetical protein
MILDKCAHKNEKLHTTEFFLEELTIAYIAIKFLDFYRT